MNCPLCRQSGSAFFADAFLICGRCHGLYRHARHYLSPRAEKARYETHHNDVHDERYQRFVSPIVSAVTADFLPHHSGLDLGAGTGPVISKMLRDRHFQVVPYDPFFHPEPARLKQKYDYIICCEVIEHFHAPDKEFALMKRLLNPGGRIYCMTHLYEPQIDFDHWYYKNDPTHVFIYQPQTMAWIQAQYAFSQCDIRDRRVTFTNP